MVDQMPIHSRIKRMWTAFVPKTSSMTSKSQLPFNIQDVESGSSSQEGEDEMSQPSRSPSQAPSMLARKDWRSWDVIQPALGLCIAAGVGYILAATIQATTGNQYILPLFVTLNIISSMEPSSHEKFYIKATLNIGGTLVGSLLGFGFSSLNHLTISYFWGSQVFTMVIVVAVIFTSTVMQGVFTNIVTALTTTTSAFVVVFFAPSVDVALARFSSFMLSIVLLICTLHIFHYKSADEVAVQSISKASSQVLELASTASSLGFSGLNEFRSCTSQVVKSLTSAQDAIKVRHQFYDMYGRFLQKIGFSRPSGGHAKGEHLEAIVAQLTPLYYDVYVMHYNLTDLHLAHTPEDAKNSVEALLSIQPFRESAEKIAASLKAVSETLELLFTTVIHDAAALSKIARRIHKGSGRRTSRAEHMFRFDGMVFQHVRQGFIPGLVGIKNLVVHPTETLNVGDTPSVVLMYSYVMYMCNLGDALCAFLSAVSSAFFAESVDRERIGSTIQAARDHIGVIRSSCYNKAAEKSMSMRSSSKAADDTAFLLVPLSRSRSGVSANMLANATPPRTMTHRFLQQINEVA